MAERTASRRRSDAVSRRNALGLAGAGIVSTVLPAASVASTGGEATGVGTFSPVLSSLATTATTVGSSHRSNVRFTWTFATTGGGSIDAIVWQFDPADLPTESLRTTPRVSLHDQVPTSPSDGSASAVGLLGVFEPVDATYDAATARVTLVPAAPVSLSAGSTFYAQYYGVGANVSILFTERTPDPWSASVPGWTFEGYQPSPSYTYAPVTALGTLV